jgi:hypothetical protein
MPQPYLKVQLLSSDYKFPDIKDDPQQLAFPEK